MLREKTYHYHPGSHGDDGKDFWRDVDNSTMYGYSRRYTTWPNTKNIG